MSKGKFYIINSKKRKNPQPLYDYETFLEHMAEYFINHNKEELINIPFRDIYNDIINKNPKVKLPKFSQARRIIIAELKKEKLMQSNENLTTEVAYRLTQLYDYYDDLQLELEEHPGTLFTQKIIPCIIPLPPSNILDDIAIGIQEQIESKMTRQLLINMICRNLKKTHKEIVLAVISDSNPIAMQNLSDTKISPQNIASSICLYVVDNEEGREFIQSLKK